MLELAPQQHPLSKLPVRLVAEHTYRAALFRSADLLKRQTEDNSQYAGEPRSNTCVMLKFAKQFFSKKNRKNSSDERGSECWYLWRAENWTKNVVSKANPVLWSDLWFVWFKRCYTRRLATAILGQQFSNTVLTIPSNVATMLQRWKSSSNEDCPMLHFL